MKITITGSLGNISKPLTETLVAAGHQVTVVSSKADKVEAIEALGATAAIGSVADAKFLTNAFTGADVVYTMVPPNFGAPNYRQYINDIANNYAEAIKSAGVKRVVNLSSIGADLENGTGPIAGNHDGEEILNKLDGVDVKHIRAGFFYVNFFANIGMINHLGFQGGNYPGSQTLIMVHPNDIAAVAAEEIQGSFTGKSVRYITSDERTLDEITTILGTAISKPDLKWVEFTDEQSVEGMLGAGLPPEMARVYTEMGAAIRTGILWQDYRAKNTVPTGKTKFESFAKEFAAVFNG